MNGFLTKKMMDNLNSAGFDINKFYSDCCYKKSFLIVEKRRKLTEDEKQEMISDGDEKFITDSYVLEDEDILFIQIGNKVDLSPELYSYETLSAMDLIYYLDYYFTCDYTIFCNRINGYNYAKIEYKEEDNLKKFELDYYNPSIEYLLCSFIIFLLSNKKYLLQI